MIIGLTGKNASGKGEVANYLKTKGFSYYSLSDVIREEATNRGLEHTRDNLIKLGNELREKFGASYLAQQINNRIKEANNEPNFVIDSIRNTNEAKELMKNKDFTLVGVDAPIELRFERMKERGRLGDSKTVEELKQQEQRENLKSDTNQQLDETLKLSQRVIVNDNTLEEFHKKIDNLLDELK